MTLSWSERRQQVLQSAFVEDTSRLNETTLPVRASPRKKSNTIAPPFDPATAAQRTYSVAWHTFVQVFTLPEICQNDNGPVIHEELPRAVAVVMNPRREVPLATKTNNARAWLFREMYRHYTGIVKPTVEGLYAQLGNTKEFVQQTMNLLQSAGMMYQTRLQLVVEFTDNQTVGRTLKAETERKLASLFENSQPESVYVAIEAVMLLHIRKMFLPGQGEDLSQIHKDYVWMIRYLVTVNLTGKRFESIISKVLNQGMEEYIITVHRDIINNDTSNSVDTSVLGYSNSYSVGALNNWLEDVFVKLTLETMNCIGINPSHHHAATWRTNALKVLADLRTTQLYDIVIQWPQSRSGLLDLKACVTTTAQRTHLTTTFSRELEKRLLHPGSSTLHILKVYISMIRTFHTLDNSKVLLARVAPSLQLYLCQRADAIRLVVTGFLADITSTDPETDKKTLTELAHILNNVSNQPKQILPDDEEDWNDMNWNPAPIDASMNFKRPKTEDIIGTLITALGSQDMFINEFQAIVAERLLSMRSDLKQEEKVLDLLKKRYGDMALQSCDVMMRDIRDSQKLDEQVRANIYSYAAPNSPDPPVCSARILSRLYWPNIEREHLLIPEVVMNSQKSYATAYSQIKDGRLLTWLDHMGQAQVELELEDRTVRVICKTYIAAVIYAFGEDSQNGESTGEPVKLSMDDLEMKLQMDTDYIEEALAFWAEKKVLRQVENGFYAVIEREDSVDTDPASTGNAPKGLLESEVPVQKNVKDEKKTIYWQFIKGMLTNSGVAMTVKRISTMLRNLVPGRFSWSDDELIEFLAEKVEAGEVDLKNGKYKIKKKK